ncbi:MAG: hypothetical protein ACR2QT_04710 [Woeseiaceae bacterium]
MQKIYIKSGTQGGNPLANILVVIVGAIIIGVSVVLGFFAFLALSAIILVAAAVIGVRVWWAQRKMPKNAEPAASVDGEFIEGEFHVVKKDKNS